MDATLDAALVARLQELVRREGRSLLQYVSDSFPWTTTHDHNVRDAVLRFARAEQDALASLSQYLAKNRVPVPHAGGYPMGFTTVNFTALSYLLPRLVDEQKARTAEVERLCNALPQGKVKGLVAQLLVLKKQHLSQLSAFVAAAPPPSLAS